MRNFSAGAVLDSVRFTPSQVSVIIGNVATLDHHRALVDTAFVQSSGQPTIFMNTMCILGLMDRFVLDWTGDDAIVSSHSVKLRRSLYAECTVDIAGVVTATTPYLGSSLVGPGIQVTTDVTISEADVLISSGTVKVIVPEN